ncbi:hypothetical protein PGB90_007945 [Kerria lacca]
MIKKTTTRCITPVYRIFLLRLWRIGCQLFPSLIILRISEKNQKGNIKKN